MQNKLTIIFISLIIFFDFTSAQHDYELKKYYSKDTNFVFKQWEKDVIKTKRYIFRLKPRKRKILAETIVKNYVNDESDKGVIEGYDIGLDCCLMICAVSVVDSTKIYCVYGDCKTNDCDPELDGIDCDGCIHCIPVHYYLYVPYGVYWLVVKRIGCAYEGDTIINSPIAKKLRYIKSFNHDFSSCHCYFIDEENKSEYTKVFVPILIDEKRRRFKVPIEIPVVKMK